MSKSICKTIRRQLDELKLKEQSGVEVARHLAECSECRDFHQKQTRLREIVRSLGTVNAPPDFDFRLRSRLATGNSHGSFHLTPAFWLRGQRLAAVSTALFLIVGALVFVRQFQNRKVVSPAVALKPAENQHVELATPSAPNVDTAKTADETARLNSEKGNDKSAKRYFSSSSRTTRRLVAADLANERAPVVRAAPETSDAVFPVDAAQQSLKVSLFDGRGNPRTISLPTVTFGSQRAVPTATSYAPKGIW
jgi:hypothetical protein